MHLGDLSLLNHRALAVSLPSFQKMLLRGYEKGQLPFPQPQRQPPRSFFVLPMGKVTCYQNVAVNLRRIIF